MRANTLLSLNLSPSLSHSAGEMQSAKADKQFFVTHVLGSVAQSSNNSQAPAGTGAAAGAANVATTSAGGASKGAPKDTEQGFREPRLTEQVRKSYSIHSRMK